MKILKLLTLAALAVFITGCTPKTNLENLNTTPNELNNENNQASQNQNEQVNQQSLTPEIKFELAERTCEQYNNHAKFNVLLDGQIVNSLNFPSCEANSPEVILTNSKGVFFAELPGGIGGYIIYGGYLDIYFLKFENNSIEKIYDTHYLTNIGVSSDKNSIVLGNGNNVILMDTNTYNTTSYQLPVTGAQIGNYVFSPNLDKIALGAVFGPADERCEIYILNLSNGTFSLYQSSSKILKIKGWSDNDTLILN